MVCLNDRKLKNENIKVSKVMVALDFRGGHGTYVCLFEMLTNRHVSGALSRVVRKLALPSRTNVVISSLSGPLER